MATFKINESIENFSPNYLGIIGKIEELIDIPNADRLKMTQIAFRNVIVSSDYKVGDIVVYFPCETAISERYLSVNNLYECGEWERNANANEVGELRAKANTCKLNADKEGFDAAMAEAKSKCGFFNKYGRVRILKLRGEYSEGFVAGVESIEKMFPEETEWNWENVVGTRFNEINGEIICTKFIPPFKEVSNGHGNGEKNRNQKKVKKYDRLIDTEFKFHFDSSMLMDYITELNPDSMVNVSVKVHGTSVILANCLTRRRKFMYKLSRILHMPKLGMKYDLIYSSRKIIKNQYINSGVRQHDFYGCDIWGCVARDFGKYIPKGMTVYGEIVGYLEGSPKFIQKMHDYGCNPGKWKFMPYRITTKNENGTFNEWNVSDVYEWTIDLLNKHPELKEKTMPITIVYHGRLGDMYPDLDTELHWHKNLLNRIRHDKDWLLMECKEPMCNNNVPREGYVFRIDNDKFPRAWKIKSDAHYEYEGKHHDKGEVDIEETGGTEVE